MESNREEGSGYRVLPSLVGIVFLPLGFFARFPLAMFTIGVTTLVAWSRGSYGDGGLASGALGVGSAIGAPLIGVLADRYGQRIVLQCVGVSNGIAMLGLVGLVKLESPLGYILILSFLIGFSAPQVGPLARARWIALVQKGPQGKGAVRTLAAAMGWESMADELTFVFGPVAVGAAALLWGEYSPLIVAAASTFIFVTWFAHHRTVEVVKSNHGLHKSRTPLKKLFNPQVSVPVFGMLSVGMVFGAMLTAVTAFAGDRGNVANAGFLYGAMGVGSAITALASAALPARFWLPWRWTGGALIVLIGSLFLPLVLNVPELLVTMFVIGLGIGPALVSIFAVASYSAPTDRMTVVMTLMSSGLVAGTALSAPVAGALADTSGYSAAFWVVTGAASLTVISGLWTSTILPRPHGIGTVQ